jgi:hypothetical protein
VDTPCCVCYAAQCRCFCLYACQLLTQLWPCVAAASAPGSVLLALSVTEAVIHNIKAKQSKGGLITHFVWGCPPDPRQARLANLGLCIT